MGCTIGTGTAEHALQRTGTFAELWICEDLHDFILSGAGTLTPEGFGIRSHCIIHNFSSLSGEEQSVSVSIWGIAYLVYVKSCLTDTSQPW